MLDAGPVTVNQYLQLPPREDDLTDELIEGEVVLPPMRTVSHAGVVMRVLRHLGRLELSGYATAGRFGCILGEYSLLSPDVAAMRFDRWQNVPEDEYFTGSPELVVEVSSFCNPKALQKTAVYLEYGAEAVWIVYPKTRTVLVHDADGQHESRMGETVSFQGVTIEVAAIFQDL
ncbi:MAG: Uma2 family endonuclease [Acidobacteriaceae bacterium]|nr:Uma2 family endonuclease [Acidobacteriaceae bacterium]